MKSPIYVLVIISFLSVTAQAGPPRLSHGPDDVGRPVRDGKVEDYKSPWGNATVDTARIVFVCERHTNIEHNIMNQAFLERHAKDGDTVLVEGLEAGKTMDQKSLFILDTVKKKLNVVGWDDMKLHAEAQEYLTKCLTAVKDVQKRRADKTLTKEFEDSCRATFKENHPKFLDTALTKRNNSLMKAIEKAATVAEEKNKKVFIMGGCAHFTNDERVKTLMKNYKHILLVPPDDGKFNLDTFDYYGIK